MSHLSCVSVRLDGRVLVKVSKDAPGVTAVSPAKSGGQSTALSGKEVSVRGLRTTSPKGLMAVASVRKNCTSVAVNSSVLGGFIIIASALFMEAEVARCVYAVQTPPKPKPKPLSDIRSAAKQAVPSGFFSSLFSSFVSPSPSPVPQASFASSRVSLLPLKSEEASKDPYELLKASIVLTIFTANAGVKVDAKLREDLLRATKKNPPSNVTVALIYVCIWSNL